MMKLKKPDFSLKDVYPSCISHYKDHNKEKLMKSIAPKLLEDEKKIFRKDEKSKTLLRTKKSNS